MGLDPQVRIGFRPLLHHETSGMGIGLSVSRSIVESHRGRLSAISNDGPGATFEFFIPRTLEDALTASHRAQRRRGLMRPASREPMTVIPSLVSIVDDDESVRESLPDLLKELGFAVQAFSSAEAFLESEAHRHDRMPDPRHRDAGMSGWISNTNWRGDATKFRSCSSLRSTITNSARACSREGRSSACSSRSVKRLARSGQHSANRIGVTSECWRHGKATMTSADLATHRRPR